MESIAEIIRKLAKCLCQITDVGVITPVDQVHGTIIIDRNCPDHKNIGRDGKHSERNTETTIKPKIADATQLQKFQERYKRGSNKISAMLEVIAIGLNSGGKEEVIEVQRGSVGSESMLTALLSDGSTIYITWLGDHWDWHGDKEINLETAKAIIDFARKAKTPKGTPVLNKPGWTKFKNFI